MSWETAWEGIAGLSSEVPQGLVATIALACTFVFIVVPFAAAFSYLERKLCADLQARVGPNRAGYGGVLQPLADFLKLLQKSGREKEGRGRTPWFIVHGMALYSTIAMLPFGSALMLLNTDMSAFLPFGALLVLALVTMLLGLNERTVSGWFGGVRVGSMALASAYPALVSILCAGVRAGGFEWSLLAESQAASPLHWAALTNPFEFVAFVVYMLSGMVLLGVPPFEGGMSVQDMRGGVYSHLHGRRLNLFRLGRFYSFFLWCAVAVVMFLGGWLLPATVSEPLKHSESWRTVQALELVVLLSKTLVLMLLASMLATVTPRTRADQTTDLALKVLGPASLVALVGTAFWVGWKALL